MTTWITACTELDPANCNSTNTIWLDYYSFDPLGITPVDVLYVLTWGMGVVLFMWSLGYGIGAAVAAIKKI